MWVFIDCYDSFSYSLVDLLARSGKAIEILQYDEPFLCRKLEALNPERLILSPGPGHPGDYHILLEVIKKYEHIPILGVCLGHQIIGEYCGVRCIPSGLPMHGKTSVLQIPNAIKRHDLLSGMNTGLCTIMHYHSLILETGNIEEHFNILATDENGQVMIIEHKVHPMVGIQFHPESVLTDCGEQLINNWTEMYI